MSQICCLCLVGLLAAGFWGCAPGTPEADGAAGYEVNIRWTSYGIPHVRSDDWRGLGYGFAYAKATDAICVIARDLVMVKGEQSRFFGPEDGHLESDVFHRAILTSAKIEAFAQSQTERATDFSTGYVAGYNRYLSDHRESLPASCADEAWVRPMNASDIARLTIGVGIRYGLGRLQKELASAAPPLREIPATASLRTDFEAPAGYGSNAVALGRAVTASGRGILFGNPHYPWHGSSRFHLIHTTIPGELDVMGVSLLNTTRVAIGFNRDIAWSHTVSTALRSTFYQLELHPDDPMQYRYGDEYRPIEAVAVTIDVQEETGDVVTIERQVYLSHYGPVVESESLPWSNTTAFAVRDANLHNTQAAETYDAINKATSVGDIEAALAGQGVAWTNTIAADRHGGAFYADISVTPNLDATVIDRCRKEVEGVPSRIVVLDGSDPGCEWREDPRSAVPGALPPDEMPRLHRDDYVANSNDSYWLSNPEEPLEGYSPIIGAERTARSLRTRAGLHFIREATASGKIGPADMQAMLYSHRNFGAELLLDDVMKICEPGATTVSLEDRRVDVSASCDVLAAWDRRNQIDSRGGHVWRELWRDARSIDGIYRVPFDASDPVGTPRGIATDDPAVRAALLKALATTQVRLEDADIPLDAELGTIQFAERDGERIPVPGGEGWAGMWSMIIADLEPGVGYSPIRHGNSFVQVISWDEAGNLDPRAIVTYSQSPEPESDHYADMTRLYSRGEWVQLPFTDAEIEADPNLVRLELKQ